MNNLSAYLTFITTPALGRLHFHFCLAWECSEIRWRRKKRRAEGKENETLCLLLCRGINHTSSSREAVFNFFFPPSKALCNVHCGFLMKALSTRLGMNLSIPFSACPFPLYCFVLTAPPPFFNSRRLIKLLQGVSFKSIDSSEVQTPCVCSPLYVSQMDGFPVLRL